jgi:tetratricopeptide (TPR) repeat protein
VKGDLEGALKDYNHAVELKPDLPVAYNNRGLVKRAVGNLEGALSDFDKAIELKPDFGPAYSNRGLVKKERGDLTGAQTYEDRALELKPDSAESVCAVARQDWPSRTRREPWLSSTGLSR